MNLLCKRKIKKDCMLTQKNSLRTIKLKSSPTSLIQRRELELYANITSGLISLSSFIKRSRHQEEKARTFFSGILY